MKKWLIPIMITVAVAFGLWWWAMGFKTTVAEFNKNEIEKWEDVQTAYQRRNDLIGNLVKTVQGAADFERNTIREVIEARAKVNAMNIDPAAITPEMLAQFNDVQSGLGGALSRLLVTLERYPELKANQNFLKLQDELTSTKNTIQTARTHFNDAIKLYNNHVKRFPNTILAGWFGFDDKPYFDAEPGAEKPVDVN